MALFDFFNNTGKAGGDINGSLWTRLRDTVGNSMGKKQREQIPIDQEAILVSGKNDEWATILRTDRKGNQMVGNYAPEFFDNFEGATINDKKWVATNTTFTPSQSTIGGYNFNNSNSIAANAVSILQGQKHFSKITRVPLQMKSRIRANVATNSNVDFGFGIPSGTTTMVTNGSCVRIVNGLWFAYITYNGNELAFANINGNDGITQLNTANTNSEYYVADLIIDDDNFVVTVQNTLNGQRVGYASIPLPLSAIKMWGANSLPCYYRVWNTASSPAFAPVLTVSEMQVLSMDWNIQLDVSDVSANLGLSGDRNPYSGASLSNKTNSTAITTITLSNTAATIPASIKDGFFSFAAPLGAETDYIAIAYQVPIGSRFRVIGARIDVKNTGAAVATTATDLEWGLDLNSTAVSLVTVGTRVHLGQQNMPIGSAIGFVPTPIDVEMPPIIVDSGRYIKLYLRVPTGTATASQAIRCNVLIKGFFL